MVSPQESDSSQSVSDSGCSYSRSPSQAQDPQHKQSHDLPSSGPGTTFQKLDLGDGNASHGGENLGFRDKKRQRSLSPIAEHQQLELQQRDQDQRGSEQDKAVPVSASSSLQSADAAINMETAVQHAWWLPSAGNHQSQNQTPGGFKVPYSLAAAQHTQQQQPASSQVIRPTSIPHEKSLFLRQDSGDMYQGSGGMMKPSEGAPHPANAGDVNMVDGSTSGNARLIGRIAELGGAATTGDPSSSARKSFVEWRPMVVPESSISASSSLLLRPSFSSSSASQLSPIGVWPPATTSTVTSLSYFNQALGFNNAGAVRPNINLPPIPTFPLALTSQQSLGAGATTNQDWLRSSSIASQFNTLSNLQGAGEQRQLLFLGPTDRDRPLSGNQQRREAIPVIMEGSSITASMCLQDYDSYARFAAAIKSIFSQDKSVDLSEEGCNLRNAVPEHIIAYEDGEGDLLLAGDLSWRKFVRVAKRVRILPAKGRCVVAVP